MKFYDFDAPNPQKVRIYAAEKGIELNCVQVDVLEGALHTPEMLAKNPLAQVPFLELDDGEIIRESLVIIEYLEALNPTPPMFGTSPIERARIQQLDRLAELGIPMECANYVHHALPFFAALGPQSEDGAEMARLIMNKKLAIMDKEIGDGEFVVGSQPSVADCTLYATLGFVEKYGPGMPEELTNLARWRESFGRRPSAQA